MMVGRLRTFTVKWLPFQGHPSGNYMTSPSGKSEMHRFRSTKRNVSLEDDKDSRALKKNKFHAIFLGDGNSRILAG